MGTMVARYAIFCNRCLRIFVYFGGFLMSDADQLYGDDKLC